MNDHSGGNDTPGRSPTTYESNLVRSDGGDRRRILFVITEDWYFLSHRLHLARSLKEQGWEVGVATAPGQKAAQVRDEGFDYFPVRLRRRSLNPWEAVSATFDIYRVFRKFRPDLTHLVALKPILYGSLAAKLARVPAVICAVAGMGYVFLSSSWKKKLLQTLVQQHYRRMIRGNPRLGVIVQNPDDRDLLLKRKMVRADQVSIIRGSGVDLMRFRPGVNVPGEPIIFTHSRMLWDKGIGELVSAAQLLKSRGVKCRVVLAGIPDSSNPASIPEATLRQWNTKGIVTWLGHRSDIPELLASSHVACLPSYREGAPLSLIEAAACGLALIASDVPGCREVVQHGVNGLLVPVRDPEKLADAIQELVEDRARRNRMGEASRRLAENQLSQETVLRQTQQVYEECGNKQYAKRLGRKAA